MSAGSAPCLGVKKKVAFKGNIKREAFLVSSIFALHEII